MIFASGFFQSFLRSVRMAGNWQIRIRTGIRHLWRNACCPISLTDIKTDTRLFMQIKIFLDNDRISVELKIYLGG